MANMNFENTVNSLFKGLDQVLSTKTVVGEPQMVGSTIIIPLMDVSFGMGAGAFGKEKSENGTGGIGGKMSPSAILIIREDGTTKLVNVRSQDTITKIFDMLPDAVNKVTSLIKGEDDSAQVKEVVEEELKSEVVREEI